MLNIRTVVTTAPLRFGQENVLMANVKVSE
jgi:hypothetical protein